MGKQNKMEMKVEQMIDRVVEGEAPEDVVEESVGLH